MALTCYFLINKMFGKIDYFYKVMFSVMYALSIYSIIYYTNFIWLDNVILFPILLLGFRKIVCRNNNWLYFVVLTLSIMLSYYIAFMEIIFILFLSFGYIIFLCPRDKKKVFIYKLGLGTVFSVLVSLPFLYPVVLSTFASMRFNFSNVGFSVFNALIDKIVIYLFYGILIIGYFLGFLNSSGNKKKFILYVFSFLFISSSYFTIRKIYNTIRK